MRIFAGDAKRRDHFKLGAVRLIQSSQKFKTGDRRRSERRGLREVRLPAFVDYLLRAFYLNRFMHACQFGVWSSGSRRRSRASL